MADSVEILKQEERIEMWLNNTSHGHLLQRWNMSEVRTEHMDLYEVFFFGRSECITPTGGGLPIFPSSRKMTGFEREPQKRNWRLMVE